MKGKLLVGLGLGLVGYVTYRSWQLNNTIKFLQYSISGLKFRINNILQPEIIFSISVYNPNRTSIPVNDFLGQITAGNNVLASFKAAKPINIAGEETQTIQVSARVSAIQLVRQIFNKQKLESIQIDGIIKTGFFDLPVKRTVSISGIGERWAKVKTPTPHQFNHPKFFEADTPAATNCKCVGFLNYS
ncbi:MAG: LEA type 2 family protein [Ferruginibacter sp.]